MFSFCEDPSVPEGGRWFACDLTNGVHLRLYASFGTMLLQAVTPPVALAFGRAGAAASHSRLLPRADITLCEQVVPIGSGLIWNVCFGVLALAAGFFLATATAVGENARSRILHKPCAWFIFVLRGSTLFIQFFLAGLCPRGVLPVPRHHPGLVLGLPG